MFRGVENENSCSWNSFTSHLDNDIVVVNEPIDNLFDRNEQSEVTPSFVFWERILLLSGQGNKKCFMPRLVNVTIKPELYTSLSGSCLDEMLLTEISQWGRKKLYSKEKRWIKKFSSLWKTNPLGIFDAFAFPNEVKFRNLAMVFNSQITQRTKEKSR